MNYRKSITAFLLALTFSSNPISADAAEEKPDALSLGLGFLNQQNYQAASEQFADAFKSGQPDGAFYLGRMLELGLGSAQDQKAAIALYLAGSAQNSAPAKNRLGVLHVQGSGVLQDFSQGAKLVCEAANLGDPNGAYNCGSVLLEGQGILKDENLAYGWFEQASELGHLGAKNTYASALIDGKFVEQDITCAIQLFEETDALGNPVGLYSLGQVFANGLGSVDQSLVKAHSYFNIAAALNHPLAAQARASIETKMSTKDLEDAQKLARAWRPSVADKSNQ